MNKLERKYLAADSREALKEKEREAKARRIPRKEPDMETTKMECQCGKITGVQCGWSGPAAETVLVEHMPLFLRASHEAARNRGAYPHNGSARLRVARSCVADVVDGDWTTEVAS